MDELVYRIRHAADQVGEGCFLELLRWHRVVCNLPGDNKRYCTPLIKGRTADGEQFDHEEFVTMT
ncbi:hypothetical protein [Dietzia sp. ANT_WB102]|uniref:hypothetical protein n=1 Tax=Dietzia sp. ANT_WB102 TaxID=2597345 RepID=UPI0011EDB311|nr:hypothetical protein [Dietzia sp. ANT_WB102]KAA0919133.1 hypothetical protein FQ137_07580 [Dietzia sp. ANT_WB102]